MITVRIELVNLKRTLKGLQSRQGAIEVEQQEKPSEAIECQAVENLAQIEATRARLREIRIAIVRTIYETLSALNPPIRYTLDPYSAVRVQQTIRSPGEILESLRQGTCVDLAALFCGLCLSQKMLPVVILLRDPSTRERHALAAVSLEEDFEEWDSGDRYGRDTIAQNRLVPPGGAKSLRSWIEAGRYLAVECTGFAALPGAPESSGRVDGLLPFDHAVQLGLEALADPHRFLYAIDVATAQMAWGLAPYEPLKVFGERRLAQMRRKRNVVTVAALAVISIATYGAFVTSREVDRLEDRLLKADPARIPELAGSGWIVPWLTSGRLKDRLKVELGPANVGLISAKRRTNAALSVFALSGKSDRSKILEVLGGPIWHHPQARTYLIESLHDQGVSTTDLVGWLDDPIAAGSVRVRQAIVLAIGRCDGTLPTSVVEKLQSLFQKDDDPGIHSAAEWALRKGWPEHGTRWIAGKVKDLRRSGIGRLKEKGRDPRKRQWFVDTKTGLTFVYFPAALPGANPPAQGSDERFFEVGDLTRDLNHQDVDPMATDAAVVPTRVPVRLSRAFALATIETPKGVYERQPYDVILAANVEQGQANLKSLDPATTTWFEATTFCNTQKPAGAEPCYTDGSQGLLKYTELGAIPFSDAAYRLPSEAEWEYAARGFSLDSYCFGADPQSLPAYCSYQGSLGPIASHMPNEVGLFDVHGSVEEWCNDESIYRNPGNYSGERRLNSDRPLMGGAFEVNLLKRICRGGSKRSGPPGLVVFARPAYGQLDKGPGNVQGFRLALSLESKDWWFEPEDRKTAP
jgi:hypothetical protein